MRETDIADCDLLEGLLYKYTNVVKGFQYRWFILDPSRGTLEYFMPDEKRKTHPRGCVHLAGCMITPSEEDSQTFKVSVVSGEAYKLMAADAKERQFWVNKLRQVALLHENQIASRQPTPSRASGQALASLAAAGNVLLQTQRSQRAVAEAVERLSVTDRELLVLKATSQSSVTSLEHCFSILQRIHKSS